MTDQTDAVEALAIERLAEAVVSTASDVADAAAVLVNVGDLRCVLRALDAAAGWLPPAEVARRVDEALAEVERRISGLPTRGPDNSTRYASTIRSVATHIVRDYRQEVRHG